MGTVAEALRRESARRGPAEGIFRAVCFGAALLLLAVVALFLTKLTQASWPAWKQLGSELVFSTTWSPSQGRFGALPMIYGTLVTSILAIILGVPIALGTALFVSEIAPRRIRVVIASLIDLLAAVPSVVYGLWGILVLVPNIRPFEAWLGRTFGKAIPILAPPAPGISYLTAGIILAIMILPTVSAVSREVFVTVPRQLREAAFALGATRWEMIRMAVLPPARPGIFGGVILGLGRALGETIAVTIVIGNSPRLSKSLLSPGYTMASVIANELSEATSELHTEALIAVGLLLFAVTFLVNIVARLLIRRTESRT